MYRMKTIVVRMENLVRFLRDYCYSNLNSLHWRIVCSNITNNYFLYKLCVYFLIKASLPLWPAMGLHNIHSVCVAQPSVSIQITNSLNSCLLFSRSLRCLHKTLLTSFLVNPQLISQNKNIWRGLFITVSLL